MVKTKVLKRRAPVKVFFTLMVVLALVIVASVLLLRSLGRNEEASENGSFDNVSGVRERTMAEAPRANFISLFVYDANGGVASFMVGGKTEEFDAFASAIAEARPVEAIADESFSDLIILSFGSKDTLELSYSRKLNMLKLGDQGYAPQENLTPMIVEVEQKFNY
ncbi:MAG: hypothetical protein WC828_01530 [Thermoleophilia bacterium]|jgi:hypothetical protein